MWSPADVLDYYAGFAAITGLLVTLSVAAGLIRLLVSILRGAR